MRKAERPQRERPWGSRETHRPRCVPWVPGERHVRSSTTIFPTRVVVPHTQIASVLYTPSGRDEKPRVAEASRLNIRRAQLGDNQCLLKLRALVLCDRVDQLNYFLEGLGGLLQCFSCGESGAYTLTHATQRARALSLSLSLSLTHSRGLFLGLFMPPPPQRAHGLTSHDAYNIMQLRSLRWRPSRPSRA